ncbi:DUF151 domain-containing protein [Desulfotomaculum copahuensis]|uniref:Uncharacterized protein n=1 Tax=Desulfotomaculum copahuensis TaxID=1838280 RepID=A0A1B7LIA3_9FIRM|nr:DUF151 domain-containing protein [Desulfotomaculum copahuensis]OAT86154.1 hypothetical protein A6M21_16950 [Desulfotomaculum copahuensis]
MFEVNIEGVRRNFMISSAFMYTATLVDDTKKRMVLFFIERHEAIPIVAKLHGFPLMRPHTINVFNDTMKFNNLKLMGIQAEDFLTSPKFLLDVRLVWKNTNGTEDIQQIQMSPGDTVGLAVLTECKLLLSSKFEPMFITLEDDMTPELYQIHDLIRREGIVLPEGKKIRLGANKTPMLNFLIKEFKASQFGKAPVFPEENQSQIKKEYLEFLIGSDYMQYKKY